MDFIEHATKASLGVLYFGTYSFCGWLLEVGFRSILQQHFVNPGFLVGPFLPLYGSFCLLVILAEKSLVDLHWIWHFVFFITLTTLLEYFTGLYFCRQFQIRLWNYYDIPLNFNGLVALPFSLSWGILGLIFERLLHPYIKARLAKIPSFYRLMIATLFGIYFFTDVVYSLLQIAPLYTYKFHIFLASIYPTWLFTSGF